MKRDKFYKAVQDQLEIQAEKKAGYPPNCNEGYAEKDGKCVPVGENSESFKKKNDKDEEKNGDDKKKNGNPFDKKKKKKEDKD